MALQVDAVELFDRAALRQCSNNEQMVSNVTDMVESDELAAGLLVECRGRDEECLQVVYRHNKPNTCCWCRCCLCMSHDQHFAVVLADRIMPHPQANIDEVLNALTRAGLPFGGNASQARTLEDYPFHRDQKISGLFWDVRKVLEEKRDIVTLFVD